MKIDEIVTFKACPRCATEGAPLCASCLHNHGTLDRLLAALCMALDGWASSASHSGWSGSDLAKVTILRKDFGL